MCQKAIQSILSPELKSRENSTEGEQIVELNENGEKKEEEIQVERMNENGEKKEEEEEEENQLERTLNENSIEKVSDDNKKEQDIASIELLDLTREKSIELSVSQRLKLILFNNHMSTIGYPLAEYYNVRPLLIGNLLLFVMNYFFIIQSPSSSYYLTDFFFFLSSFIFDFHRIRTTEYPFNDLPRAIEKAIILQYQACFFF